MYMKGYALIEGAIKATPNMICNILHGTVQKIVRHAYLVNIDVKSEYSILLNENGFVGPLCIQGTPCV